MNAMTWLSNIFFFLLWLNLCTSISLTKCLIPNKQTHRNNWKTNLVTNLKRRRDQFSVIVSRRKELNRSKQIEMILTLFYPDFYYASNNFNEISAANLISWRGRQKKVCKEKPKFRVFSLEFIKLELMLTNDMINLTKSQRIFDDSFGIT